MRTERVAIVGAGIAGLCSAIALASRGIDVVVLERAATPGGKMRQVNIGSAAVDSGPTVFTMRWVFEELFADAGQAFSDAVQLTPLEILARHAWTDKESFDLFADNQRTTDAIGDFSGAAEAARYSKFCEDSRRIYQILEKPFLRSASPSMGALMSSNGLRGLMELPQIKPFTTMWNALGQYFHDPRLRQLFGRYATYCGSSPFDAPATLMLIAHVEREGVWSVEGGMYALANALAHSAVRLGATIRYESEARAVLTESGRVTAIELDTGEHIETNAVIMNSDVSAVATGLFGKSISGSTATITPKARSLSAMTWSMTARTNGFALSRHSVFFSQNYRAEFDDIFRHTRLPEEPTVYVCAQDRDDLGTGADAEERLLVLVNAPPIGDRHEFDAGEIERCAQRTFGVLERCGLTIDSHTPPHVTTPSDFNRMFPATGGALYGRSSHGWAASFQRPGARTKIPGLYLAGGSVHPGPGVPMAALSGRAAAASIVRDFETMRRAPRSAAAAIVQKGGTAA